MLYPLIRRLLKTSAALLCGPLLLAGFTLLALLSRFARRPIDVGLGPEPLINNVHHKRALNQAGYTAETFVSHLYFITNDFDLVARGPVALTSLWLGARALFRYKALYIYFNGGPLAWTVLRPLEPLIYRLAGQKVLVMPYGGDVDDMTRCPNYPFRHAMNMDYPRFQACSRRKIVRQIDLWSRFADHIISGCDWVDFMPRWDTLCLAHFSIDTDELAPAPDWAPVRHERPIRILHAPNHVNIKGTGHIQKAVRELQSEGYNVELDLVQGLPNVELRKRILAADIIADQLVVGWYAMFALEGMSAGKPVLCRLREDLLELYEFAGLVDRKDIPLIRCDFRTVKDRLRELLDEPQRLQDIGRASREYVARHHSLKAIGAMFDSINRAMGISPTLS